MSEKLEDIELRSEEVKDILTYIPHWMIRYGNVCFFLLILCAFILTWFIKYPDVINSQSIITTEIPPQKEYAKVTGKLETILVEDNQDVTTNTPLAIIENTANYKDVLYLKSILDTITPNNSSFEFPIESIPILFLGDIETDYALFENNYIQYQIHKELKPFNNEVKANRITQSELQSRLRTLRSQKRIKASELKFEKNNLDRHKALHQKGVISKQEYESKELLYLQAERDAVNIDNAISQIKELISDASRTSSNTSINRTREDIRLLKNTIQSFNQLKRAVKNWELNYVLSSDIDGKVSFLNTWTENVTVNQGDLIFTIIPKTSSRYIAKLKTPAQNSGKIKTGQTVNISLENYPSTEYGSLKGEVESIALFPDQDGNYLITVNLPNKLKTSYNKEILFKHEMRGAGMIITEDLRLVERFFYQLKDILDN